jgi:non-canonical (house-cleaning) NTP pyrophosphatase
MEKKIIIAVGTLSKKKILYLKSTLRKLQIEANVVPIDVNSGVSHQPHTSKETKIGSLNRAQSALEELPEANVGIGIEMGGDFNEDGKRETCCWASVVDKDGHKFSAKSFSLRQPKYYADILKKGKTLGNYRHDFKKRNKQKGYIYEYLGKMLEYRRPFISNAIENVLIYYFCRDEF